MSTAISGAVRSSLEYEQMLASIKKTLSDRVPFPVLATGLCTGAEDAVILSVLEDLKPFLNGPALILCPEEKECLRTVNLLERFGFRASFFTGRDLNFFHLHSSHEPEIERLKTLSGILFRSFDVVVSTPFVALSFLIPPARLRAGILQISLEEQLDKADLMNHLVNAGYARVEMVDNPGQFASRGGIVDIFPPFGQYTDTDGKKLDSNQPIRIEFFGDEIDRLGLFDNESQRLTLTLQSAVLPPAREMLAGEKELDAILSAVDSRKRSCRSEEAEEILQEEHASLQDAKSGKETSLLDKYISLVYPEQTTLFDYFPSHTLFFYKNTAALKDKCRKDEADLADRVTELVNGGTISPRIAVYAKSSTRLMEYGKEHSCLYLDNLTSHNPGERFESVHGFRTRQTPSYAERMDLLLEDLAHYQKNRYKIALIVENEAEANNLRQVFDEHGIKSSVARSESDTLSGSRVLLFWQNYLFGYELIGGGYTVLTTYPDARTGSLSQAHRIQPTRRKKQPGTQSILSYAELQPGDLVVHERHGIGRYLGISTLTINGVTKDYLEIQYAGSGKLSVSVERFDTISKYIGSDAAGDSVKLASLGGDNWGRMKAKAKASVQIMAKELIQLYAQRTRRPGFAFPPDDDYQRDFEASFEYQETNGQLMAIEDIKEDMMKPVPMDRLLCGDVGFGKTEVALRAAFKAVLAGKQVAILVPTTILALQHLQTANARMRSFGVNIDMVSRFRSSNQIQATLRALKRGDLDIIIGTHRLLSRDVEFRDLGLLIIDEEQRFGVAQKERIKQVAQNVDVLTLTATPIPRTLNMAMGGIRDISILDEAPGDRVPVQTYVMEENEAVIMDALQRELRRGGQIFWLHNDIYTIDTVGARLAELLPDKTIRVAHGRMDKMQLEQIWADMIQGRIDILVCTTIIETGIDIPNANTLIVDNAYRLGLSQLHQLRGRIGRSSRRAYAYFTYPRNRALPEIAEKRLAAIRDYAEFGAGFRIAIRDLELRGAGNLLGAEQHGHLAAIGYDLFIKLLNQAVLEEQGLAVKEEEDCQVSVQCDALLPENYIPFPTQRMAMYKKISTIRTPEDENDILDELVDRYGDPPKATINLLHVALLRATAARCGLQAVQQTPAGFKLIPGKFDPKRWMETSDATQGRLKLTMGDQLYLTLRMGKQENPFSALMPVLNTYLQAPASDAKSG